MRFTRMCPPPEAYSGRSAERRVRRRPHSSSRNSASNRWLRAGTGDRLIRWPTSTAIALQYKNPLRCEVRLHLIIPHRIRCPCEQATARAPALHAWREANGQNRPVKVAWRRRQPEHKRSALDTLKVDVQLSKSSDQARISSGWLGARARLERWPARSGGKEHCWAAK